MSFSIGTTGRSGGPGQMLRSMGGAKGEGRAFDWRVVSRMLTFLQPHRAKMAVAFVLMLMVTGLTLLTPYLVKVAIDQNITQGDAAGLTRTALYIAAAFIGTYLATMGQRYLLSWVGQRVLATVREQLVRHLQVLPLGYHDRHIVGVTISRVIGDVAVINELLSQGLITLIGDLLVLCGIIIVMFSMSPQLALLTFSVLPIMLAATWIFSRHAKTAFRNVRARVAGVVGSLAEALTGIRVIKAYAQEEAEYGRFEKVNSENRAASIAAMSLSFIFLPTVEFLGVVATAVVLWFGGRSVVQGNLTLGIMVAFLAYVTRFFAPIQELSQLYTTMQAAMAGGERVLEMLDTEPAVADPPDGAQMPPMQGRIELRDVDFAYEANKPVLRGVNLLVQPGQTVALVGQTGAGKSSIANLISRFYDVTDGAVLIDNVDVRTVTQQSLRSQMGVVTQDPFLFSGSVTDNIRFGIPNATQEEVETAARLANAHDFIVDLPNGYATEVQEGGANLSIGQRQLICIARAVLADPRILIMDEATASVDTVTELLIQEALDNLLHNRTSVVIAHRLSTIRNADQICVIQDGKIAERGRHAELLALNGIYRNLHERQFVQADEQL